jgi:hypothetical protein
MPGAAPAPHALDPRNDEPLLLFQQQQRFIVVVGRLDRGVGGRIAAGGLG